MKKIIKFSTPTCQPCKNYSPIFQSVSTHFTDIEFEEINCFENPEYARSFRVCSVPCTIFLDEYGVEIKRITGLILEEDLKSEIIKDSK